MHQEGLVNHNHQLKVSRYYLVKSSLKPHMIEVFKKDAFVVKENDQLFKFHDTRFSVYKLTFHWFVDYLGFSDCSIIEHLQLYFILHLTKG